MAGISSTVADALADRYAIERELGRGGMATVYLAHDIKHDRKVALKVLRPELSHVLGRDRFVQEVRIIARLQHPHILPLFDSGEAAGQLWYTMPYVEGESLRQRLDREGQLSLDETLRISRNALAALAYAHQQGIIHRDLKPANILLESGEAVLADFGIAHAVDAAGGDRLTESGLALGTPTYMSPEQAAGRAQVDGRSDLYGFGCVLYEMLAGEPPFTGTTPLAVLARHAVDPVPPLHTLRSTVPSVLERVVMKALAKAPADRFATATEFAAALATSLDAAPSDTRLTAEVGSRARRPVARMRLLASVAVLAAFGVAGALTLPDWNRIPTATLNPKVVAVVPFRVTGADSSLSYLREGMLDLLATKLSGTRDLRTVDPRTLLRAWRRAGGSASADVDGAGSLKLARQVGAGRLLEGEVVGTPDRLVLNAKLSEPSVSSEVRASVEGPSDSLTTLVDRLAAQLLVLGAGMEQHRLAALTTTSLPALRAYLDGRAAHRRGDYATAFERFDRAIALDSSFALAGLGHTMAAGWVEQDRHIGLKLAWRHRDRLSSRDLAQLRSMEGPRYPSASSLREDFLAHEAFVALAPDDPEAWTGLADMFFHNGRLVGMSDAWDRSIRAYQRALALDSSYAPSLEHLAELYYDAGDISAARRAVALHLRLGSGTRGAALTRWFAQTFLGDTAFGAISLSDDSLLTQSAVLSRFAVYHQFGLAQAESVLTLRRARVSNEAEQRSLQDITWAFYVHLGRPGRARALTRDPATPQERVAAILAALYADADSTVAVQAQARVPRTYTRPGPETDLHRIREQYAAAQYDLSRGRTKSSKEAVLAWKGYPTAQDTSWAMHFAAHFAMLLDAQLAALTNRADALGRLTELDSTLQEALAIVWFLEAGNLAAARLWHERGDQERALAAVRRRRMGLFGIPPIFAASLRDEGRYAALAGDREGAIKAYRHYLTLRRNAEPHLQPQVEAVRAELAALEREFTDR